MVRRLAALALEGERARLRLHRAEDARAAFELLAGREEILRWLVWEGPASSRELAEHYGRACVSSPGGLELRLALEDVASGALAGSFSLRFPGQPGQGDVGYWVGLAFQKRGLGREALELLAHLAFEHLATHALNAWVFVGNASSRRVLERTGFTLVRSVPGRVRKSGQRIDEWHFVLLASEWRRLRADFRPRRESLAWEEAPGAGAQPLEGGESVPGASAGG